MKRTLCTIFAFLVMVSLSVACTDVKIVTPQGIQGIQGVAGIQGEKGKRGEKGQKGIQGEKGKKGLQGIAGEKGYRGDDGISAYDSWKSKVLTGVILWQKDAVTESDFFRYLQGKDGSDGEEGKDGESAYDLWKRTIASGEIDDPHNKGQKWAKERNKSSDFFYFLTGQKGEDGLDGEDGDSGKSAYRLWVEYISSGNVENPHNPDEKWNASRNKMEDFWDFITGRSSVIVVELGKYNVIPEYWRRDIREWVKPSDGSVEFTVYNKEGQKVSAGVKVRALPSIKDPHKVYETNEKGEITIPAEDLPDNKNLSERKGSAIVVLDSGEEETAKNTLVPNRINIRVEITKAYCYYHSVSPGTSGSPVYIYLKVERQVDGLWGPYPSAISTPYFYCDILKDPEQEVTEQNLGLDNGQHSVYYTYSSSTLRVTRPQVLLESEKKYKFNISREWNQRNDNYLGVWFGDGATYGNYDYGYKIYLPDKIQLPEQYPVCGFKEDEVYIDINPGHSILWGELDIDNLPNFYKDDHYNSVDYYFVKDETTHKWTHPKGKMTKEELHKERAIRINMGTTVNETGGEVYTTTWQIQKGGSHFKLTAAYPGNWIGISLGAHGSNSTYDEYRARYAYKLHKGEDGEYYLSDYYDETRKIPVKKKSCPTNWMDEPNPKDLTTPPKAN